MRVNRRVRVLSYWSEGCYRDVLSFGIKTHLFFQLGNVKEWFHQIPKYVEHIKNVELFESQPFRGLSFSIADGQTQGFLLDLLSEFLT